jgi:membrane dipeptidase
MTDSTAPAPSSTVQALLADLPVFDAHHDAIQLTLDLGHDLAVGAPGQFDLPRARRGGVGASVFACWVDGHFALPGAPVGSAARAHALIDALHGLCAEHPDQVRLVRTAADLERARTDRVHGAVCGIEGGHAIENRIEELERFAERGLRCMTLVWNNHLPWIRSCQSNAGAGVPDGIDDFGRQVVRRMEELGVMVDLSHAGERSVYDVLDVATKPVIASHSGCNAVRDHRRNLDDDQLRAIAANGGVVGIVFHPGFLDEGATEEMKRVRHGAEYRAAKGANYTETYLAESAVMRAQAAPFRLGRVVDHIQHAVEVMGIEHVGIGSDYDGIEHAPQGLEDASGFGALAEALLARGFTKGDVRAVLGGNMRRVFGMVLPR